MVNLFRLGSYRFPRWSLLLIPLFSFADFGVSDSATLNQIAIDVAHAANASQGADRSLVNIASDTAYLTDVVYDSQQNLEVMQGYLYKITYPGLRSITNALWGIFNKLETEYQYHNIGDTHTSYNSIYTHDVRTDDIYSKLGDLQDSINNLTNYLCYSPSFVTSINTNLPFLLMSIYSYQGDAQLKSTISGIYKSLYGHSPSSSELDSLLSLTKNNNITRNFGALVLRDLPYSSLSALNQTKYSQLSQYYGWQGANSITAIRNAGDIRYSFYGTRVLTDTVIGISNLVANITNGLYDVTSGGYFEEDTSPNGHGFKLGRIVRDGVSSVMEDLYFTDNLNTNVEGSVWSNNIARLSDSDYQTPLNNLRGSTPEDFADLNGILSEISTAQGAIDEALTLFDGDHDQDFVLPLRYSSAKLGEVDLSLTLPNVSAHTLPVVQFLCHFIQIAIALYFFRVAWAKIVTTVNFYNEPDPF